MASSTFITPTMKKQKLHTNEFLNNPGEQNSTVSTNNIDVNNYLDANFTISDVDQNVSFFSFCFRIYKIFSEWVNKFFYTFQLQGNNLDGFNITGDLSMTPSEIQALLQSGAPIRFELQNVDQQLQQCQQDQQLQSHQLQQLETVYHQMSPVQLEQQQTTYQEIPVQQNQPMCPEFTAVTTNDLIYAVNASTFDQRLNQMETQLTQNTQHIESVDGKVDQILKHTSRIDKMLSEILKKSQGKSSISCEIDEQQQHATVSKFGEFENFKKIETAEELKSFEKKLSNIAYEQKLIRFLHTKFTLDGQQKGATIFKDILRSLVVEASLFKPYSWVGQKRNGVKPLSFKENHKVFIDFMKKMVQFGDSSKTDEHVEKLFENTLRFKNVIEKRESARAGASKEFVGRNRRKSKSKIANSSRKHVQENDAQQQK